MPADHWMDLAGQRAGLVAAAANHDRHRVLVYAYRSVALRRLRRRRPHLTAGRGHLSGMHTADTIAQSARLGWMPFYPQFNVNPLDVADKPRRQSRRARRPTPPRTSANALAAGTIKLSIEDVDAPENWPRTLTLWRSNLFGSSAKGNEYFLKYLLGTHSNVMACGSVGRRAAAMSSGGTTLPRASSTCCCRPTSG